MTDLIKFDTKEEIPNIIKVIGVGGGGGNAVTHMFTEGIQGVDFILCNTDKQALDKSPVAKKIHLGKRLLGAGNKPDEGHKAAIETTEELREILAQDTKMLFITAGMGGGTGTGAAPVVAEVARELDILTVGIVTLPFSFEGKRRQQQALLGIEELRKHVDALLVISNDKLRQEHGDMKLAQAFKKADDVLKTAAKGIAEIITVTGYVNVDFQDVNTVMRNSGKAIMGSGYAEGEGRALRAVTEAVHSPLLDDSEIAGAKNILVYITSGTEEVSLDEVTEITEYVQEATGNCSDVIWGNGEDLSLGEGINVTLIATGFEEETTESKRHILQDTSNAILHEMYNDLTQPKNKPLPETETQTQTYDDEIKVIDKRKLDDTEQVAEQKANDNKKIYTLGNEDDDVMSRNVDNNNNMSRPTSSERNVNPYQPTTRVYDNPFNNNDDDDNLGITSYVRDSADTQTMVQHKVKTVPDKSAMSQQEMMRRQRLSSLNMNFRSMANIEEYENQPAYKRLGINLSNDTEEQQLSAYSSSKDRGLRESNSFLHDNVD
ncbi:MAG: cell division protein FtsZ [Bacteroidales bacterium]|nr:cell division protein FtsZ [Bacteroidales bacterium]